MSCKTLKLLEYDVVRNRVAALSHSAEARQRLLLEEPLYETDAVKNLKNDVFQIVTKINAAGNEPHGTLPEIEAFLPKLNVEGTGLSIEEAYATGKFVLEGAAVIRWLGTDSMLTQGIPDCTKIPEIIFAVLDKDGNMRELPRLRAIKQRITSLSAEIQNRAAAYTTASDTRNMLQSNNASVRDGRVVLALKANFKGRLRGIVHDVSSGGQTIFIEPEDIVEKNNELLIQQRNLEAEILAVLREMTIEIKPYYQALCEFFENVMRLEMLRAKAHYSVKNVFAKDGNALILKQARHPHFGASAVPIDLIMNDLRAVIITGPNTGGKTASLKTAGLFALMNQAGLALPAAEGTILPVFDGVFADIGDEQSLAASLSTFSAHISNISGIINDSTEKSLVLLDELGSGTDPVEGCAIAMAVMDHLIETKCRLLVTTHHGALKNYGWTHPLVENASVEFDTMLLAPLYRIVMGIPGESRAIEISRRYGLLPDIIEKAKTYIESGSADVSALIAGLKEKHLALDQATREFNERERDFKEALRKSDLKELRLRQKEAEIKSGSVGTLRALLSESRKTLENLVRELKENGVSREETLKVKEFLRNLEDSVQSETAKLELFEENLREKVGEGEKMPGTFLPSQPVPPAQQQEFKAGGVVLAGDKNTRGILRRRAKNGAWVVEVGSLSMTYPEKDLIVVAADSKPQKNISVTVDYTSNIKPVAELNVRGMRLQEALETLQKQIDAAVISGLTGFSVVHGKGDGILSQGIHGFLKNQSAVSDYYFSRPELGGAGRTEVILTI
ncbi:endonuclease MutS2 [Spirochaetia bacterium]|nr:endonuclease MutS2 [Spirochaetia bacterium]